MNNLVKRIVEDMNMSHFQECVSKLISSELFYETFGKEVTQAMAKYIPYR